MKGIAELDLTGFAATEDDGIFENSAGVRLHADFKDGPPALRHWQDDEQELLKGVVMEHLAARMATMECWIDYPGGLPALFVMFKQHQTAERGKLYSAFYYVPRADCALTITLWAAEKLADVGRREQVVDNLMPGRAYIPSRRMPVLRTPGGTELVYDYADAHEIDRMFPDHALTHLRTALRQVFPSVRYESWFTARPAFQAARPTLP